ncbi:MAG: hypothetical protein NC131_08150 [Roseburia sp.]|nr:hypothetical protein [Roseburia sp.]
MSKSKTTPAQAEGDNGVVEAPAAVAEEAPKTTKAEPAPKRAGFCCYIGPTIPGVIQSGHIYGGTRAEVLKTIAPIVEERPLVASLLVDGETLAVDRIKAKTPGNLLHVNYMKLASGETK